MDPMGGKGDHGCRYLMQIWHQILVQRANQHVQSTPAFLGKGWGFQGGFFTINYYKSSLKKGITKVRNH